MASTMDAVSEMAAPLAAAAVKGVARVGSALIASASSSSGNGRGPSPTFGLGIGAAVGATVGIYRCVRAGAEAADASAAQALKEAIVPTPRGLNDALDMISGGSHRPRRQRRHSWTAGWPTKGGEEQVPYGLAPPMYEPREERAEPRQRIAGSAFSAFSQPSQSQSPAPVTPVASPDGPKASASFARAGSPSADEENWELQCRLAQKLGEVQALQRQHALALSSQAEEHSAASSIARKWREKQQRGATRELLRNAVESRAANEAEKGAVAAQVAEKILSCHPSWSAHESAAGMTRIKKIHTVLARDRSGGVRRTSSWGTPRAGDGKLTHAIPTTFLSRDLSNRLLVIPGAEDRAVDFFLFEFAVQLPPMRFKRSQVYSESVGGGSPPPLAEPEPEPEPELARPAPTTPGHHGAAARTASSGGSNIGLSPADSTPIYLPFSACAFHRIRSPSPAGRSRSASPTHEEVADRAVADAILRACVFTYKS